MPRKIARSSCPTAVRAPGMVTAVGTARRSCGKAGKARIFTPIQDSSGESRFNHGRGRTSARLDCVRRCPKSPRMRVSAFIEPCLPSPADRPPSGPDWIHEVKHDGYRLMARRDPVGVRLLTRNAHDWASRFPLIVAAVLLHIAARPDARIAARAAAER